MSPPSVAWLSDSSSSDESFVPTTSLSLLELAAREVEQMRQKEDEECNNHCCSNGGDPTLATTIHYHKFPPACHALLKKLPGNQRCFDCGERDPEWAAVSYGALLCLKCSGHHRSLGVQVSTVKSLRMDHWSLPQCLAMLEGGNAQLHDFFFRHLLCEEALQRHKQQDEATRPKTITKRNVTRLRYKTKAALFYRENMSTHITNVLAKAPYDTRHLSRRIKQKSTKAQQQQATRCLHKRNTTLE